MNQSGGSTYKRVRGLARGLDLLYALNQLDGGASVATLSTHTGIHRTTARRLLETLVHEGYVRRSRSDDSYWLERKVRVLSEGYRDEQWVSALASPLLNELLQVVSWPTDLTTLDVDAMVIRETTHRSSRLSFHRSMVGRRLPLLVTASGRAYLAFCPDNERETLISILAGKEGEEGALARDRAYIDRMITETRARTYGVNCGEWASESRFAAIAVPIIHCGRVYACLGLVYMASAMTPEEAAGRYLAAMKKVTTKIEAGLARMSGLSTAP